MTERLPYVARADADGDGPPKRTRRPALSCIECRIRKVKCDRNEPCAECIRTKSEKCTYRPGRSGIRRSTTKPLSDSGNHHAPSSLRPSPQSNSSTRQSALGHCLDAESGSSETVTLLLRENERLRSALATNQPREEGDIRLIPDTIPDVPGTFQKSKFFGQSHWMNAMEPYEALGDQNTIVNPSTDRVEVNKSTELYKTVSELKTIGRVLKTARMLLPAISPETLSSLPTKETCDALVEGYLRTFEGVFRILHIPSFRKEYHSHWSGEGQTKPSVLLKIMLVCAIGVTFYTGADQPRLRVASAKWIQAAEAWVAAPHAKSRLNMSGLQIQILILLGKQACNMEGDHTWITAGSVLRTAMYLGLHRDPAYFGKINTFHAEMRRRLWATVLELTVQSSLDMGMPPLISVHDYDTKPPANVNDDEMQEQEALGLSVKPPHVCTDCSIQIAFAESVPVRLEIVRQLNSLRFGLSYSECLRLGKELSGLCDAKIAFFKQALRNGSSMTPFQVKLFDSLVRRFVLGLHRPFFVKARDHPQYHFSRKVCLDASLAILAPATLPVAGVEDDWTLMTYRAVGFFKALVLYAISTVYYELNTQLEEQRSTSGLTLPLVCSAQLQQTLRLSSQAQTLYDTLVSAYYTAIARLRHGETNAKGVVFFACAVARVDALVAGADPEAFVLEAAKTSIAELPRIMADVYEQEHGETIDLSSSRTAVSNKQHGRGEGADDVTGHRVQTGTNDGVACGPSADIETGDSGFEMEFGAASHFFSPGGSVDFDFQFLQDPEWFFDACLNGV